MGLAEYIQAELAHEKLVIKMDIEGAEFLVLPTLGGLLGGAAPIPVSLSLHPHLLAQSVKSNNLWAKIRRRLKLISNVGRVLSAIGDYPHILDARRNPVSKLNIMSAIAGRGALPDEMRECYFVEQAF